jgi:hypothetical protein
MVGAGYGFAPEPTLIPRAVAASPIRPADLIG